MNNDKEDKDDHDCSRIEVASAEFEVGCVSTEFSVHKQKVKATDENGENAQEFSIPILQIISSDGGGNLHHSLFNFNDIEEVMDLKDMLEFAIDEYLEEEGDQLEGAEIINFPQPNKSEHGAN
jgi:hypothetical protein